MYAMLRPVSTTTSTRCRWPLERSAAILGDRARRSWPVDRIDLGERWVQSAGRRLTADTIVIATGVGLRRLPAATDGAFGGDVTYQLGSDLDRFAGRPVVVIGGGDNATLDALALAQIASPVTLVHRSERSSSRPDIAGQLRDDPRIIELGGWELDDVRGDDRLEEVVLVRLDTGERRSVKAGGLVVKIGKAPRTDLFRGPARDRPLRRGGGRRNRWRPHARACSLRATWSPAHTGGSPPPSGRVRWRRDPSCGTWRPRPDDRRSLARATGERGGEPIPTLARSPSTAG